MKLLASSVWVALMMTAIAQAHRRNPNARQNHCLFKGYSGQANVIRLEGTFS